MGLETKSFEAYGFKIEVHAGGRRVWPPSFKRFVKQKLGNAELTIRDVMKTCSVSQSLVYKWRSDVARANGNQTMTSEEPMFSEIVFDEAEPEATQLTNEAQIKLRGQNTEVQLPPSYPVDHLLKVILALEGRS